MGRRGGLQGGKSCPEPVDPEKPWESGILWAEDIPQLPFTLRGGQGGQVPGEWRRGSGPPPGAQRTGLGVSDWMCAHIHPLLSVSLWAGSSASWSFSLFTYSITCGHPPLGAPERLILKGMS